MRLILALILALASTGQAQPAITWSNIVWDSGSVTLGGQTVDHAALLLAVRLDGLDAPGVMQLDTGTPATVLHREVYGKLRRDLFNGSLAGRRFENERFSIRQDAAEPPRPGRPIRLGTIGATFFEHRVLLIDFVRQRVAILDSGGDLPPAIARRFEFLPLEYRNYKMFVPLSIAGAAEYDLAFDTGSSAVPLFTSRRLWTGWTGREPADRRNTPLTGKAWGKGVTLLGAPLKATLCAGNACLSAPLIFFDPSGLPSMDLDRSPYRISGIFGNRLFDGRYTIVIDLPTAASASWPGPWIDSMGAWRYSSSVQQNVSPGLFSVILKGDSKGAIALTRELLDAGAQPAELLESSMIPAMEEVGRCFGAGELFVPELLLAGRAMRGALDLIRPRLAAHSFEPAGRVVIGTVLGDVHDIGKNIVSSMLEGGGFEIVDLGVDVPPAVFVDAVRKHQPDIVALSALLTVTMPAMRKTIDALAQAGVRGGVRVMVGGAPVTRDFAREIGADAYSPQAAEAVALARSLVGRS